MPVLPDTPPHLLLAVPHEETRKLLRTWLSRQGFLVTTARDGDHAMRLMSGLDFDIAVADPKPVDGAQLTQMINTILDRAPRPEPEKPKDLRFGPFAYDVAAGTLTQNGERVKLTATEVKLMRALTATPNHPITRAELMDEMGETEPGSRAVDVQITRLRRKLEADPKMAKYLQTVRGTGYVLMVD